MDPLIVTVAAVGAELTRADQPNLPVTPDELAADAVACREAGASIYHLHVRDDDGAPTMDVESFRRAHEAITSATDLIVQFTTGGAVGDPEGARVAPLELRPEMATLTTGSVNFGDAVFSNPAPLVQRLYERMRALGIVPEFEIFEAGMIESAVRLYRHLESSHHMHFDFVLDVPGALPAWPETIEFLAGHLPEGATWSATGIGRRYMEVADAAVAAGGHVRTGLEDVLYVAKGERARSNAELVERVLTVARARGRPIAEPSQARELLGIEPRV